VQSRRSNTTSLDRVVPTKHQLLILKEEYDVVQYVHRILEDRKEVQLGLLKEAIEAVRDARQRMNASLSSAYAQQTLTVMTMGRQRFAAVMTQMGTTAMISGYTRRVARLAVQGFALDRVDVDRTYGFLETSSFLDDYLVKMQQALRDVIHLAEAENVLFTLFEDMQKKQRLINVLEHVLIPRYQRNIAVIDATLEENEREELIRLKMIKERLSERSR
jgi:V/A-type H+-transporting ATPase subunit D